MKKQLKRVSRTLARVRARREIAEIEPILEELLKADHPYTPLRELVEGLVAILKNAGQTGLRSSFRTRDYRNAKLFDGELLLKNIARVLSESEGVDRQTALHLLSGYFTISESVRSIFLRATASTHSDFIRGIAGWTSLSDIFTSASDFQSEKFLREFPPH
ncbi:MAG: hypothetical protein KBC21_02300 [Candidatus Pacebacteria bacterium]|nr:hypothetical protein [Candidatus Paceibacterota bacterium]